MVQISGLGSVHMFFVAGCLVPVLHAPRNMMIKTAGMDSGCLIVFFRHCERNGFDC